MAVTTPTSPEIEIENGGGGGGSPTTSPTTTTTAATAPEGLVETPAATPAPGPSTPQYKYLVLNHADTPNVKTILEYQYPDAPATAGYVHFTGSDPQTYSSGSQNGMLIPFEYGGTAPILSQFIAATSASPTWITIISVSTDPTTTPMRGSINIDINANSGNTSTARTGTITFSGDNSGATSATNNYVLTISQNGNMTNSKNNY